MNQSKKAIRSSGRLTGPTSKARFKASLTNGFPPHSILDRARMILATAAAGEMNMMADMNMTCEMIMTGEMNVAVREMNMIDGRMR